MWTDEKADLLCKQELDDGKVHVILAWAVNTRKAENQKGRKKDFNKYTFASNVQDACLEYINRWGNEEEIKRLTAKVARLKKENRLLEALLDTRPAREGD